LRLFADTFYWVAIALPDDQWAGAVIRLRASLEEVHLVTTEEVLIEFLTALSGKGESNRRLGAGIVRSVLADAGVTVVHQTHRSFLDGLALYEKRMDKGYSMVDCISMNVMRRLRIRQVLTNDRHFAQEGFAVLL